MVNSLRVWTLGSFTSGSRGGGVPIRCSLGTVCSAYPTHTWAPPTEPSPPHHANPSSKACESLGQRTTHPTSIQVHLGLGGTGGKCCSGLTLYSCPASTCTPRLSCGTAFSETVPWSSLTGSSVRLNSLHPTVDKQHCRVPCAQACSVGTRWHTTPLTSTLSQPYSAATAINHLGSLAP